MTRGCLTETRAKKWQHSSPAHQNPVVQNLVSLNKWLVKVQNVTEFEKYLTKINKVKWKKFFLLRNDYGKELMPGPSFIIIS